MTTRPELATDRINVLQGLAAVALFVVLAVVFVTSDFGPSVGFDAGASITASLGYALFNLPGADVGSEGFLAAFLIIAIILDAALEGSVMLASRESDEAATDGGTSGGEN